MLTLEIFFSASKAEGGGKKKRRFYSAVSRLDINAILSMLALRSLDPSCSTDNSQKSICVDSLPPDFIILYMFGKI